MKIKESFKHKVPKRCIDLLNRENSNKNICMECKKSNICKRLMEIEIEKELENS